MQLYKRKGCRVLGKLANKSEHKVIIGQLDGINVILNAMRNFPDNRIMLEKTCGALMKLTTNADNQVIFGKADGIVVMLNAMQKHSDAE